ncbi:Apolipoprotein E [Gossypium arboreum]|uniref:Apolipoprotein E n=1 Tax=Gossypium arboreum TaxID=29729 RepID=A0A0B0MD70_GOSAR|nr:Apolipoprotein E [Gossypium arboreum]
MTSEAGEIMEKLKEKKAEYEAIASTDSSVNLQNIDNRIITEVLGPERYGRVRFQGSGVIPTQYFGSSSQQYMPSESQAQADVQRLRDQIAHMQASTVEQIAEVQRKYEELQQQLRANEGSREGGSDSSKGGSSSSRGARGSSDDSRAEQKEGLDIGEKVHFKSAKISGVFETPLKAMTFSGVSPTNAAKSLDLLWHFFQINAAKFCGASKG